MANLPLDLEKERIRILKIAESYNLDIFDTIFEMVTYDQMNQIASYGGFPVRYPHWRFGMEYERLAKGYEYGLSKIYEMVVNTNPCYAYLMEGNLHVDQKLVMAHVYGHCDFFKNNQWFSQTDRKMMDTMANHATRIRRYVDRHGQDRVETFVDQCLSLENLIDRYSPYKQVPQSTSENPKPQKKPKDFLLPVEKSYMEKFINPPDFVEKQKKKFEKQMAEEQKKKPGPERDILLFLMTHAPLETWQQDIISIIRAEAYYFAPQGMTKIMNEGWASFWHTKLMTKHILSDSEVIDYADHHSGTVAMSPMGFNPYKVGLELFRNIENRWNKGQFGKEWNECDDMAAKENWDTKTMQGREKIFEIRRNYNDVTFIDEFLTEDFCVQNKMFVYKYNKRTAQFEVDTRDFPAVKKKLLFQLTNFGQPIIHIENSNYENRGEILLKHLFEGIELQPDFMKDTMINFQAIWTRPINLVTVLDGEVRIINYDGKEFKDFVISDLAESKSKTSKE